MRTIPVQTNPDHQLTAGGATAYRRTFRRRASSRLSLTFAVATAILASAVASGVSAPTATAEPLRPNADWVALDAAVARDGIVPVIVTLRTKVQIKIDKGLSENGRAAREADVADARASFDTSMGQKELKALKAMTDVPLLAFHADADDLATLRKSKEVADVLIDESHEFVAPEIDPAAVPADATSESGPMATSSTGQYTQLTKWWDYYRIGVDKTSAAGWRGTGQTVAIIDSGVDRNHTWIKNVVNEACFASATVGSSAGYCPNGTWTQLGYGAARPCTQAQCGHGTHVAHTAAGAYGVAPSASIMAIQVFRPGTNGITYSDSDILWALKHVYDNRLAYKIAAVNMSLGYSIRFTGACDTYYSTTSAIGQTTGWINALKSAGIATVISSGNDGYRGAVGHPACISTAVTVGNTTIDGSVDNVFISSNSSAQIDLLAPGTDICSAVPNNGVECGWIGTSMAAPHVAGAFAVLRQRRPTATVDQIVSALQRSGVAVSDGYGITRTRINVANALSYI